MKSIILFPALLLFMVHTSLAQESKKDAKAQQREVQYQDVLYLLKSKEYEFIGRKANPQKGPLIDLTTRSNFLRIDNNNAAADMPYFGRAYSGGYSSSDGGIKFDGIMENYQLIQNDKKKKVTVKFKVKGEGDVYNCTLSLSGKENASLSVLSNNKQGINYTGIINPNSKNK